MNTHAHQMSYNQNSVEFTDSAREMASYPVHPNNAQVISTFGAQSFGRRAPRVSTMGSAGQTQFGGDVYRSSGRNDAPGNPANGDTANIHQENFDTTQELRWQGQRSYAAYPTFPPSSGQNVFNLSPQSTDPTSSVRTYDSSQCILPTISGRANKASALHATHTNEKFTNDDLFPSYGEGQRDLPLPSISHYARRIKQPVVYPCQCTTQGDRTACTVCSDSNVTSFKDASHSSLVGGPSGAALPITEENKGNGHKTTKFVDGSRSSQPRMQAALDRENISPPPIHQQSSGESVQPQGMKRPREDIEEVDHGRSKKHNHYSDGERSFKVAKLHTPKDPYIKRPYMYTKRPPTMKVNPQVYDAHASARDG